MVSLLLGGVVIRGAGVTRSAPGAPRYGECGVAVVGLETDVDGGVGRQQVVAEVERGRAGVGADLAERRASCWCGDPAARRSRTARSWPREVGGADGHRGPPVVLGHRDGPWALPVTACSVADRWGVGSSVPGEDSQVPAPTPSPATRPRGGGQEPRPRGRRLAGGRPARRARRRSERDQRLDGGHRLPRSARRAEGAGGAGQQDVPHGRVDQVVAAARGAACRWSAGRDRLRVDELAAQQPEQVRVLAHDGPALLGGHDASPSPRAPSARQPAGAARGARLDGPERQVEDRARSPAGSAREVGERRTSRSWSGSRPSPVRTSAASANRSTVSRPSSPTSSRIESTSTTVRRRSAACRRPGGGRW